MYTVYRYRLCWFIIESKSNVHISHSKTVQNLLLKSRKISTTASFNSSKLNNLMETEKRARVLTSRRNFLYSTFWKSFLHPALSPTSPCTHIDVSINL